MALTARKYFFTLILLLGTFSIGIIIFNYAFDLQGIFCGDEEQQKTVPNQRFVKVRYLVRHPERFDSFVFGSSRVNSLDVTKIPGGRWYNMTYDEGLPREHLQNIQYMLKRGIKIKSIMIGIDEFSYTIKPEEHQQQISRMLYSPVTGESTVMYYLRYLLRIPSWRALKLHLKLGQCPQLGQIDILRTGRTIAPGADRAIEAEPERHAADPRFLQPGRLTVIDYDNLEETLHDIADLVKVARKNNIKLTFFINPIHQVTYRSLDLQTFFRFKKRLALITDYYDFSGLNGITADNYYFYESAHYRPLVGDKMIDRMSSGEDDLEQKLFGVLVTSRDVAKHIENQQKELAP